MDTLDDIAANKVCTVVSRAEIKDYIDLISRTRRISIGKVYPASPTERRRRFNAMVAYLVRFQAF